jgi:hypothetical protein
MVRMSFAEIRAGIDGSNPHLVHVAALRVACNRAELRLQQHLKLARAIERAGGKQLVDAMFDRHLPRRWWRWPIIQMCTTDCEQRRLRAQRQRVGWQLDQRSSDVIREGGSFFFSQFNWVVRRPISA